MSSEEKDRSAAAAEETKAEAETEKTQSGQSEDEKPSQPESATAASSGDDSSKSSDAAKTATAADSAPLRSESVEEDEEGTIPIDQAVVDKLADGFLQKFLPPLEAAQKSLEGVLNNQQIQIETIQQENAKFRECAAMEEVTQTMAKAKRYYAKLIALRKEMTTLHEKSAKLKKRALKIQQQKHKEELQRAQQREKELEHERMLSATVAKPPSNSAS